MSGFHSDERGHCATMRLVAATTIRDHCFHHSEMDYCCRHLLHHFPPAVVEEGMNRWNPTSLLAVVAETLDGRMIQKSPTSPVAVEEYLDGRI